MNTLTRLALAAAALVAALAAGAGTAAADPGDSITTLDGPSYSYRYLSVDVDDDGNPVTVGPWHHGSGHRVASRVGEGTNHVEVIGRGTCTTTMTSDGTVMDQGDYCRAWSEGLDLEVPAGMTP